MHDPLVIRESLERAVGLLARYADVVDARVTGAHPPAWVETRGWRRFLLDLPEAVVERSERCGPVEVLAGEPDAPESLIRLVEAVRAVTAMPWLGDGPTDADAPATTTTTTTTDSPERGVGARKQQQISALAALCQAGMGGARRIVDVGAGHGHLTRTLRARLGIDSIGLERDPARLATARALAGRDGPRFERVDAVAEAPDLRRGDLAVGLHACGDLGDVLVRRAGAAGAHLLLVSCCPQKIAGDRRVPLSRTADHPAMHVPRDRLGLANLPVDPEAAPDKVARVMFGREVRHGLRHFLAARGIELEPGAEARGFSRHRFPHGLAVVAALACERRGLSPPTVVEIERAERQARTTFGGVRRSSLPRNLLGRVLETAILLDRARYLEELGYAVEVGRVFGADTSPRNLGILARAP